MEDRRHHGSGFRLDIQQLQLEAQHRWFRPAEISEILQNYQKFHIASEPPHKPLSGSLFLFDRKVLRFFRKDGHNWRKKKDGKTIKEAHEKLKVGSVDVLHCYYAHGEENENFQRRSYWLLEEDFMHIVFVHYLEVKGSKMSASFIKDAERLVPKFQNDNYLPPSFSGNNQQATSANTDSPSPTSSFTSTYEEYEFGNQSVSGGSYTPVSLEAGSRDSYDCSFVSGYQGTLGLASWEEALEYHPTHMQTLPAKPRIPNDDEGQLFTSDSANKEETDHHQLNQAMQVSSADQHWNKWHVDQILGVELEYDTSEQKSYYLSGQNLDELFFMNSNEQDQQPMQCNIQKQHPDAESIFMQRANLNNGMTTSGSGNCSLIAKHALLEGSKKEDSLKKADSFSRWIAKELGDVEELHTQSSNGIAWSLVGTGDLGDDSILPQLQLETDSLNPSLSHDQLFSILDFTPSWAYSDKETEVLIKGIFLKSQQEVAKFTWSCMFGEVEVPAQIIAEGCLCCCAPPHRAEVVPFYITCSNRLACSEVREFEYRVGYMQNIDALDVSVSSSTWTCLHNRLEKILSSIDNTNLSEIIVDKQFVVKRLVSLMEEEEKYPTIGLISEKDFSGPQMKVLQKNLKHKLYSWLLYKVTENGKGPNVLDEDGQGVLHLAAALGYNWALNPVLVSGVTIDFRDVNGWTALHWAAFCGREDTVVVLVSLGAAPGALTHPSPEFPSGRTPAELASGSGHKGISGFLAESSLTMHVSSLTMNDSKDGGGPDVSGLNAVQSVLERTATPSTAGAIPDALSLRDSLAAVCNATQAVSRIHQIFRMQSFQRKQLHENDSDELGPLDEHSISRLAFKTSRMGQTNGVTHDAAISIQKKFRGWKKRKEFLIIRQRIVKIQAHVRGHQVRKKYPSIIWSVGILEKVILRWRRKGSGLRGFRSDAVLKGPKTQYISSQEDDYDFLREGRKKAEERFQKALARVKSMAQYPEGRAQYRRLLTVAEGFRGNKDTCDMTSIPEVAADGDEDLTDLEALLDDDTFMSIAFE